MFKESSAEQIQKAFDLAKEQYKALGVDVEDALDRLDAVPISVHCWQGDDVTGFEVQEDEVGGGGIMATGNYPGPARNGDELRADAEEAFSLIPGALRFNLHAIYAETAGEKVDRDELKPEHFRKWMDWAGANGVSLDFNPTFFAHPKADDNYTLSHSDEEIRKFWVRHAIACRRVAEAMGRSQGTPCVVNHWIPDGAKDNPTDRWGPRRRLVQSLDEIMAADIDPAYCKDAVESKLFGLGVEDYTVGSHEFYMGYGLTRDVMVCLDMGHYHPTETIRDKLSALLTFQDELLLHVSRPIRWDSDHVVLYTDEVKDVFQELVRGNALDRANVALDFFDATINRVGAWVVGTRAAKKAVLYALLEPVARLQSMEQDGDLTGKLALLEELKSLSFGAVWDMYCHAKDVPVGPGWLNELYRYDREVTRQR